MGKYKLYKELDIEEEQELKDKAQSDLCFVFAKRLRQCFIDSKISQNELSDKICEITGIETNYASSISQYLKAKTNPSIEIVLNMAKAFNVSVDYLLGNTDVKTLDTNIQAVCDYTGLTENALQNIVDTKNTRYITTDAIKNSRNSFLENKKIKLLFSHIFDYIQHEKNNTGENLIDEVLTSCKAITNQNIDNDKYKVISQQEETDLAMFRAEKVFREILEELARSETQ